MNKRIKWKALLSILVLFMMFANVIECKAASTDVKSIEVMTEPKTNEYCVGDSFVSRGLSLLVTYESGDTKIITSGYSTEYDFQTSGKKDVTISYKENDISVKTNYSVMVFDNPVISTDSSSVDAGQTFTIPVIIEKNCGLMGMQLQIEYDKSCFVPIAMTPTDWISNGEVNDSIATSQTNQFSFIWAGSESITDNGTIAEIEFLCKKEAIEKSSDIVIRAIKSGTYNQNYNAITCVEGKCSVEIIPEKIEKPLIENLAVRLKDWTVGEEPSVPEVIGNSEESKFTCYYADKIEGPYDTTCPTEAGTYYLKVVVEESEKYASTSAICSFSILEKEEETVVKKPLNNLAVFMKNWMEGESASVPQVIGNDGDGKVTYLYATALDGEFVETCPTSVGDYYLKIVVEETESYLSGSTICSFSITKKIASDEPVIKKNLTSLTVSIENWTEDKKASIPTLQGNEGNGEVTYYYGTSVDGSFSTDKPKVPGNYILKAVVAETEEYNSGISTCTFKIGEAPIKSKKPSISSIKNIRTKKIQVSLKSKVTDITGCQIRYSTKKSMTSYKSQKIKGVSKKYTFKNISKNKKYYVKIRFYKTVGKKTYYSKWSSVKTCKVTK